ncbi:MAG: diguanylate cyclase [Desulfobulbaceae bacterium]|nr:diguanylate cyclase [Desulfobulbaceae bacterium]HIJ78136.1 diguanylate cyclase [Deltaproteobacteria bacterium]
MSILIVDDTPVNLMLLEEILEQEGYDDIHCARSGLEALDLLADMRDSKEQKMIDLVLLDVMMPGLDGIETCRRLKAVKDLSHIPVIMVTVRDDDEALEQAFNAGAIDYIVKPVKEVELLARVRSALKLKEEIDRRVRREKELVELTDQLDTINKRLMGMAQVDNLTELGSGRYFSRILEKEWNRARREGLTISLVMIDLDDFASFNELYGREAGDNCLKKVAGILNAIIKRAGDSIVRYGGDEFAIILPNTPGDDVLALAQEIQDRIEDAHLEHAGSKKNGILTVSIGLATAQPAKGNDVKGLIAAADGAAYLAKNEGANQIRVSLDCS